MWSPALRPKAISLVRPWKDLDTWLQLYPTMPTIEDPSCPGTTFNHRWNQDQYTNFRTWMTFYAQRVGLAYAETDKAKSIALWQQVFGSDFKTPAATKSAVAIETIAPRVLQQRAPQEEFIEEKGFSRAGGYRVRIECTVEKKAGFRHGSLRSLRRVGTGRSLRFRITSDVPGPFDLYWKVRNTGPEAARIGQLRGQLLLDNGSRSRVESTSYRGRHYVEAYVVKNGKILASDRHDVVIE